MCKSEMVRQKHPSWGNPPAFPAQPHRPNSAHLWLQLHGGASPLLTPLGLCSHLQLCLVHQRCRGILCLNFWRIFDTAS